VRGAHHRRCAREGLTEPYDALSMRVVASTRLERREELADSCKYVIVPAALSVL